MLTRDLDLLMARPGWPSVTVVCDSRWQAWPELRSEAAGRLAEVVDTAQAGELMTGLDTTAEGLGRSDWPSVAVFASPSFTHGVELPTPARPRVVVDRTFATRDLVVGPARTTRYLVLTIDGGGARLLAGLADRLDESVTRPVFPLVFDPPPDPGERRQRRERSQDRDAHADRCHRAVDDALEAAVEQIGDAIGSGRFAAGLVDVWEAATQGRVDVLAVDPDHHVAAVTDADHGGIHPVDEPVPGGIDDAVDELIEMVLTASGRVEIVAPGAIDDWDRLAARLPPLRPGPDSSGRTDTSTRCHGTACWCQFGGVGGALCSMAVSRSPIWWWDSRG